MKARTTPWWHVFRWLAYWWRHRAPWPSPWPERHIWRRHRYRIRVGRAHIGRLFGARQRDAFDHLTDADLERRFQDSATR